MKENKKVEEWLKNLDGLVKQAVKEKIEREEISPVLGKAVQYMKVIKKGEPITSVKEEEIKKIQKLIENDWEWNDFNEISVDDKEVIVKYPITEIKMSLRKESVNELNKKYYWVYRKYKEKDTKVKILLISDLIVGGLAIAIIVGSFLGVLQALASGIGWFVYTTWRELDKKVIVIRGEKNE